MANQLAMDKPFAINNLRAAGYLERRNAQTLEFSRGAVRRHLQAPGSNGTTAPTGSCGENRVAETVWAVVVMNAGKQREPFCPRHPSRLR